MLNEYIILIALTVLALEDIRKGRIHIVFVSCFLAAGILCIILTKPLSAAEAAGGAALGLLLLCVSRITDEAIGYGDGLIFLITGVCLGFWENFQLLFTSLILSSVFAIVCLIKKNSDLKKEIPFVPFVWGAHLIHLGGIWYEKIL